MLLGQLGQCQVIVLIVDSVDQHHGFRGTRSVKKIETCSIPVKHLHPELPQCLNVVGIMIQDHYLKATGHQQTPSDLTEPTEASNDDPRIALINDV
ncbi:hypothetical protein D3C76_1224300 [compost metagenome]